MSSLGTKLEEYWQEIRHKRSRENPNSLPVEDAMLVHLANWHVFHTYVFVSMLSACPDTCLCVLRKRPDQNWVQCDDCLKWRKLPDGIDCDKLPDKWFCRSNPDPQFR